MPEKKQILSQDLKLPAGVTVTPGHLVDAPEDGPRRRSASDRRLTHLGVPEDLGDAEHLSTYKAEAGAAPAPDAASKK